MSYDQRKSVWIWFIIKNIKNTSIMSKALIIFAFNHLRPEASGFRSAQHFNIQLFNHSLIHSF